MLKDILKGSFIGHPLHPLLVHLPIGFWLASLIFDIIAMAGGNAGLGTAALYLIGFGILGALLAAPAGLADFLDIPGGTQARRIALSHGLLNVLILGLYFLNFFMRGGFSPYKPITGAELALNCISIGLLLVSGYLGGTLVFHHGVGLKPEKSTPGDQIRRVA